MLKIFVVVFLAVCSAFVFFGNIGRVGGYINPVVGPAMIFDPRPAPPPTYRTVWQARAEKLRDCDFAGIEWFLGPRNGRKVEVLSSFSDKPTVRPTGLLEWEGLNVGLDPAETLENSHSDVLHQCFIFGYPAPWLTRSLYYDPR